MVTWLGDKPSTPAPPKDDSFDPNAYASELEVKYGLPLGSYVKLLNIGEHSGADATSPKGAYGRAQLMPGTAADMGVDIHAPKQNLEGGAKYLKAMYDRFGGDLTKAYAAYNEGPAGGGIPNNPETKKYVERLMGESDTGVDMSSLMRAPGGPDNPQTKELQKEGMAALGDAKKAEAEAATGYGEDIKRYEKMLAEHDPEIPLPPTLKDLPKPIDQKDYIKDPTRVMGQFLPVLAILGSRFTRLHATTAMNAAAEAMNAAKKNDKDSFDRANETWKEAMQKGLDEWKQESERYRDALDNAKFTAEERQQKLQVAAALSNSRYMREAARTGQFDLVWKALQMGDTAWYKNMQVMNMTEKTDIQRRLHEAKIEQEQTYEAALKELRTDPEYQKADPIERAKKEAHLTRELMPNDPWKLAQAAHQIRQDVAKTTEGVAHNTSVVYMPVIEDAASKIEGKHMWDHNPLSSSEQAAFLDAYTRLVTGGQAIRGFTLKLNMDHASILQKLARAKQQIATGGSLSLEQEQQMVEVARRYTQTIQKEYESVQERAEKDSAEIDPRLGDLSQPLDTDVSPAAPPSAKPDSGSGWSIKPVG